MLLKKWMKRFGLCTLMFCVLQTGAWANTHENFHVRGIPVLKLEAEILKTFDLTGSQKEDVSALIEKLMADIQGSKYDEVQEDYTQLERVLGLLSSTDNENTFLKDLEKVDLALDKIRAKMDLLESEMSSQVMNQTEKNEETWASIHADSEAKNQKLLSERQAVEERIQELAANEGSPEAFEALFEELAEIDKKIETHYTEIAKLQEETSQSIDKNYMESDAQWQSDYKKLEEKMTEKLAEREAIEKAYEKWLDEENEETPEIPDVPEQPEEPTEPEQPEEPTEPEQPEEPTEPEQPENPVNPAEPEVPAVDIVSLSTDQILSNLSRDNFDAQLKYMHYRSYIAKKDIEANLWVYDQMQAAKKQNNSAKALEYAKRIQMIIDYYVKNS